MENFSDLLLELLHLKRFLNEAVRLVINKILCGGLCVMAANDDHPDIRLQASQLMQCRHSIHMRHGKIQNNKSYVICMLFEDGNRFSAVSGAQGLQSHVFE